MALDKSALLESQYYIRLERGNAIGISESVIDGLAHALQLDEAERAHLLDPSPHREHDSLVSHLANDDRTHRSQVWVSAGRSSAGLLR